MQAGSFVLHFLYMYVYTHNQYLLKIIFCCALLVITILIVVFNFHAFQRSEFKMQKTKEKPPLQYIIPKGAGEVIYEVHALATYIKEVFKSIKVCQYKYFCFCFIDFKYIGVVFFLKQNSVDLQWTAPGHS